MLIYNVTIQVQHSIHHDWLDWMQTKHIPDVMATNCFVRYQFVKLLEVDETEGVTYAAQYFAANKEAYDTYINQYAPALREDGIRLWGNKFIGFRSLMEVVN